MTNLKWSRAYLFMLSLIVCFAGITEVKANTPQIAINAVIYPMYKPDFDSPETCSQSSVTVSRNDGKDFAEYDKVDVGVYAKEVSYGLPISYGSATIVQDVYTSLPVNQISIPVSICMRNITGQYVKGEISEVEVRVKYFKDFSIEVGSFSTIVNLQNKTPEAQAIEKLQDQCDFSMKEPWLAVINQQKSNIPKGKPIVLTGTFFRNGIPSPNDTLRLYLGFGIDPKRGSVKMLSQSLTDKDGVFRFEFIPQTKESFYTVTFQARTAPIGPIHGPFKSGNFRIIVDCKTTCNYQTAGSITDWIPKHSPSCLAAFDEYNTKFALSSDSSLMYEDSKNRIPFLYRKVFVGSKGKKSYFNDIEADGGGYSASGSSSSGRSSGGRCYVSGYTTKTGKRVSGYWRSC